MKMQLVACALVVAAASAKAQALRPMVMPHPLAIKRIPGTAGLKDAMQREYQRTLRAAGATVPGFTKASAAIEGLGRTDCEREDACLAELAKKADALYAVFATIDENLDGVVAVNGRVIRDDGVVMRTPISVSKAKGKGRFEAAASLAFAELFASLKIAELPPTRPVASAAPPPAPEPKPLEVAPLPPPSAPPVVQVTEQRSLSARGPLVIAGSVAAAVGLTLFGVGVGLGSSAKKTVLEDQTQVADDLAAASQLTTARTLTGVGLATLGAGAVAALIGLLLPAAPAPSVGVSVDGQGVFVSLGGAL